ncbi:MAG: response regulator, partial [Deltaproteobacteria bacterium]|nr:response regulator [Deltaproteobacteria bacterium]
RRIDVAKVKAEQLKRTEAQIVATACHNCVDALSDLIKYYKLDMKVKVVSELVSEAMVMEKRVPLKVIRAEEIVRGKGEKILVIDDEPDVITFLTTLFEDHGYRTIPAYSVDEALKKLASDKPDMITLDILMPGKTGIKLYHELRTTKNIMDIPVIIITGVNPVDYPQIDFRKFIYERSLPHEVPCYISVQDPDLIIQQVNRRFREDFGNGVGHPCFEIYKHRKDRCPTCPVAMTFEDGMVHSSEETVQSHHGEPISVVVYTAPLMAQGNKIGAVMEMSTNISEMKNLQAKLVHHCHHRARQT